MGLDAFTITKEIWENHSRLISCIMARLLGSRCLVSIQVKLVFRLRTKLMNRGGGEAALNTESSEEIYMMLTSKAIHFCFYVVVFFLGGGGWKTLFQICTGFGRHGNCVVHITGTMEARAAAMCYVLCQVKLKDTCFSV